MEAFFCCGNECVQMFPFLYTFSFENGLSNTKLLNDESASIFCWSYHTALFVVFREHRKFYRYIDVSFFSYMMCH